MQRWTWSFPSPWQSLQASLLRCAWCVLPQPALLPFKLVVLHLHTCSSLLCFSCDLEGQDKGGKGDLRARGVNLSGPACRVREAQPKPSRLSRATARGHPSEAIDPEAWDWVALGISASAPLPCMGRPHSLSSLSRPVSLPLPPCEDRPRSRISSSAMALAVPVTVKTTETGGNERFDYAVSAMQGHREYMEDAHAVSLNLDAATGTSFFGVYDGHGGPAVSKYCARHLHIELRRHERFRDNLQIAIERTFLRMDEMMKDRRAGRELSRFGVNDTWKAYRKAMRRSLFIPFCHKPAYPGPQNDGCTACVVLIRGNQIIVGNAGDSRCVLSRNDQAIDLSNDFKPNLPVERQRIEAAGHMLTFSERGNVHRIDDGIAVSRALGDLRYKDNNDLGPQQQAITAFPEVRTEEITQDDQFLIIACDGIWDCLTSQQAVDFIRIYSSADVKLDFICEALLGHCLAQPRGRDNMTAVLVRFKTPGACQVRARNVVLSRPINQAAPGNQGGGNQAAGAGNQGGGDQADGNQGGGEEVAARPAEMLVNDAYRQILLRLPADRPKLLYRFAAVCRSWRSLLTDPAFLRCYRKPHRLPRLIGYVHDGGDGRHLLVSSFVATADPTFRPRVPEKGVNLHVLDSRHGRVIFEKLGKGWADGSRSHRLSSGTPSPTTTRSWPGRRHSGGTSSTSPPPSSETPRDVTTSTATAARSAWCSSASGTRRVRRPRTPSTTPPRPAPGPFRPPPPPPSPTRMTGDLPCLHLPSWWEGALSISGPLGGFSGTGSVTRWSRSCTLTSRHSTPRRHAERSSCQRRMGG